MTSESSELLSMFTALIKKADSQSMRAAEHIFICLIESYGFTYESIQNIAQEKLKQRGVDQNAKLA